MINNLNFVKQLGFRSKKFLETGKLIQFANYQQFKFKQNKIQIISNYISFSTFLL